MTLQMLKLLNLLIFIALELKHSSFLVYKGKKGLVYLHVHLQLQIPH
jgi:hypothetical protein